MNLKLSKLILTDILRGGLYGVAVLLSNLAITMLFKQKDNLNFTIIITVVILLLNVLLLRFLAIKTVNVSDPEINFQDVKKLPVGLINFLIILAFIAFLESVSFSCYTINDYSSYPDSREYLQEVSGASNNDLDIMETLPGYYIEKVYVSAQAMSEIANDDFSNQETYSSYLDELMHVQIICLLCCYACGLLLTLCERRLMYFQLTKKEV